MKPILRQDVLEQPGGNELVLDELIRFHSFLETEARNHLSSSGAEQFVCQVRNCSIEYAQHILFSKHYSTAESDKPLRITIYSPTVEKDKLTIGEDKLPRGFLSGRSIQMCKEYNLYRAGDEQKFVWAEHADDSEDWSSEDLARFWVLSLQAISFR